MFALARELQLPVKHIVLGSAQYEHKIFVAPFARRFPKALVYAVQQWSWPLDLPAAFFGIFATELGKEPCVWGEEIDQELLCPKERNRK